MVLGKTPTTTLENPNINKILLIKTERELFQFVRKYKSVDQKEDELSLLTNTFLINWIKVARDFGGIEISRFFPMASMSQKWYRDWEIGCGCIWNLKLVKEINIIK